MTGAQQAELVAQLRRVTPNVFWANQTRARPARPFIEVAILNASIASSRAELAVRDAAVPAPGAEIELLAIDHIDTQLQARVYSASVVGDLSALTLAGKVRSQLAAESTCGALGLTGVAVVSRGPVQAVPAIWETVFEGIAVLNFALRTATIHADPTTWIESVDATINGAPVTVEI